MENIIRKLKQNLVWAMIVLAGGILLGWLLFRPSTAESHENHDHTEETATTWTCSMHPQIRQDEPGQCPICAMDLVPVSDMDSDEEGMDPGELRLSESAIKLAEIRTQMVRKALPMGEIYLQGKVRADERRIASMTARFGGRIEQLHVNFTGEQVVRGQKLATIYSPELLTAQRELLEALRYKNSNPSLYNAARGKLRLWDLSEEQIDAIETAGEPMTEFEVLAPITGTVTRRDVALGDYVSEGSVLFEVTDLSRVWIMFDAYEQDLPWISTGDPVRFEVSSLPGNTFTGRVSYIDPVIDPRSRVARIRVEQVNEGLALKPGMFVSGIIESGIAGKEEKLLIPKSAVLWTGKRSVVYVRVPGRRQPTFHYREIELGPEAGDQYVVAGGLEAGEEIAVNGAFRIDAAAQLAGKPSMMNPAGGMAPTGHDHGSMEFSTASGTHDQHAMEQHTGGSRTMPGQMSPDITAEDHHATMPEEAPAPEFRKEMQSVFNAYKAMTDALVKSDREMVRAKAEHFRSELEKADMGLLEGGAHLKWMEQSKVLGREADKIIGAQDLSAQRLAYASLNDTFYESLKYFGLPDGVVYYQYCPMANGDNGAYWLSTVKEINNPYFGDEMLRCGETRETIEFE